MVKGNKGPGARRVSLLWGPFVILASFELLLMNLQNLIGVSTQHWESPLLK